jgi:hypothetical protein
MKVSTISKVPKSDLSRLMAKVSRIDTVRWLLVVFLVLGAVNAAFFYEHYSGRVSIPNDFALAYYAVPAYWQASIAAGEWPHWLPYQSMGYPFAMNPQTGIMYPPFWVFVLFRIPYTLQAANIFQALHILFGAVGFFLFARALFSSRPVGLVGGVAFQLFGGLFTNAQHADIVRGWCILPWLLWASLLRTDDEARDRSPAPPLLVRRNLFLPMVVFLLITGSYPGLVISGLLVAAIALGTQLVVHYLHDRPPVGEFALTTAAIAILVACGVLCSATFLLPTAFLARFLTRSALTFDQLDRIRFFLRPEDLLNLFFTTKAIAAEHGVYGRELSMLGMQLPGLLLLFLPYMSRIYMARLLPFAMALIPTTVMCLEQFRPLRRAVFGMVPALGLSRFPAADYRFYIWLILLLCALSGLDAFLRYGGRRSFGYALRAVAPAACFAALFWLTRRHFVSPGEELTFERAAVFQLITLAVALAVVFVAARLRVPRQIVISALCVLSVVSLFRGYEGLKGLWSEPDLEYAQYQIHGVPLREGSRLRAASIFERRLQKRPPRLQPDPARLSWRGYITGEFLTTDQGQTVSVWRSHIESDPKLLDFALKESELRVWTCEEVECGGSNPRDIDLDRASSSTALLRSEIVQYGRNAIHYRIQTPVPMLAVENELFAEGWTGHLRRTDIKPKMINSAFRGWELPPGTYEFSVEYRTPWLTTGIFLSCTGFILSALMAWFWQRRIARLGQDA